MQNILMNLLPPLVAETYIGGPVAPSDQQIISNASHCFSPCLSVVNEPGQLNQVSHNYREAVVVQSDLCGFTQLASYMLPEDVVELVGGIFSHFDNLAEKRGVYKIETKGDAYYAGQAEAPLTAQRSALGVISFGLDMLAAVEEWSRARSLQLTCRVGIHFGECIGGVVGNTMKRYHLFGRLMTVLDILESTSPKGCLQASQACVQAAEKELSKIAYTYAANLVFEKRKEPLLTTSKGFIHQYDEVDGPTFLIRAR
jgi:class 3 adenylate cyclase